MTTSLPESSCTDLSLVVSILIQVSAVYGYMKEPMKALYGVITTRYRVLLLIRSAVILRASTPLTLSMSMT